jgi:nicotinamidase-related amidase
MSIGKIRVMRRIRALNPGVWRQPVNATEVWFKHELAVLGVVDPLWVRRPEMYTWFTEEGWAEAGSEIFELALSRGFSVSVHEEIEADAPHVYNDAWQLVRYPCPDARWLTVPTGPDRLEWFCSEKLIATGYNAQPEIDSRLRELSRQRKSSQLGLPHSTPWSEIYDARRQGEALKFELPECATWRAVLDRRRRAAAREAGLPKWVQLHTLQRYQYVKARNASLKKSPRLNQTLVVVDVQSRFITDEWANQQLVWRTVQQIRLARALGWPIVLTCMVDPPAPGATDQSGSSRKSTDFGDTHPEVVRALTHPNRYERFEVVCKIQQDGSQEVLKACKRLGSDMARFRIVGLYAHQCVWGTVRGVSSALPNSVVEVVKRACFPQRAEYWDSYLNLPNVLLLPAVTNHSQLWDPWMPIPENEF